MSESIIRNPDGPVLVIGGAGIDIVGRLKGELHPSTSTPAQIRSSFGGVARNVAENLARLGQSVRLITAVGEDEPGERLIVGLQTAGVDTSTILHTADYRTGSYLGVINPAGELQFALDDMRAISAIKPAYLDAHVDIFKEASILFLDGNLSKETLRKALSLARRCHLPVCADPTSTSLAARFRPYLDRFYLLTPNSSEAAQLCEPGTKIGNRRQALQAAKCLVSNGVSIAIITLAEHGLCYATTETSGHVPAIHSMIVDPTGAGDALSAAVIFAILNEMPVDDAVRLGVSAASYTMGYLGAVAQELSLEKLYDRLVI